VAWPNQLDITGYESSRGSENWVRHVFIGLVSWAASEGSMVSSLICDRWLTHKFTTFVGLTDSLECSFSCHDQRLVAAVGLDSYGEPASTGGGA